MPVHAKRSEVVVKTASDPPAYERLNIRVIDSSNVEWVGWPSSGTPLMIVKYIKNEKLYGYIGVTRQRAVAAAYADSTGSYINKRIKGSYRPVILA